MSSTSGGDVYVMPKRPVNIVSICVLIGMIALMALTAIQTLRVNNAEQQVSMFREASECRSEKLSEYLIELGDVIKTALDLSPPMTLDERRTAIDKALTDMDEKGRLYQQATESCKQQQEEPTK